MTHGSGGALKIGCFTAAACLLAIVACSKDSESSAEKEQGGASGSGSDLGGANATGGNSNGGSAGHSGSAGLGGSGTGGGDAGGPSDGGEPSNGGTTSAGGASSTGGSADGGTAGTGNAGTGNAGSGGAPDEGPITVVVLGASTAAGKNIDQPMYGGMTGGLVDTWPNRYATYLANQRPGSTVVNLAKSGYSTYHALPTGTTNPSGYPAVDSARNVTAALAQNPDVIIVQFPGGAELGLGDTVSDIIDNYRTIADTAAAEGVETWIATTQPTPAAMPADISVGLMLRGDTLTEFGTHALDFWDALAKDDDTADAALFLTDDTHPNAAGHLALYDVVVAADIPGAL